MNNPNQFPRPLNPSEYNQQFQQFLFHQQASAMAYNQFLQWQTFNNFQRLPFPNFNFNPLNAIPPPPLQHQHHQQQRPQQRNQRNRRQQNIEQSSNQFQPPPLAIIAPPLPIPSSMTASAPPQQPSQQSVPPPPQSQPSQTSSSTTVPSTTNTVEDVTEVLETIRSNETQTTFLQEKPPESSSSIPRNLRPRNERKNYSETPVFIDLTLSSDDEDEKIPSSTTLEEASGSKTADVEKNETIKDDDINFVFSDDDEKEEEEIVETKLKLEEKEKASTDIRKKRHSFFRQNRHIPEENQSDPIDDNDYQPESEEDEPNSLSSSSSSSSSASSSASSSSSSSEDEEENVRTRKFPTSPSSLTSKPTTTLLKRTPPNYYPLNKVDSQRKFGYGINRTGEEKGRIWLETEADKNKIHIFTYFDKRSDAKRYICSSCAQRGKHTLLEIKADPNGIESFMEDSKHVGNYCILEWKDFQIKQEQFQRSLAKKKNNEEENFPPNGTRLVPEGDFEFGYNRYRICGSRMIVREEANRNLAREYNIHSPYAGCVKEIYRCVGCVKQKYVAAYVRKGKDGKKLEVAVPFNWKHLPSCKPKTWKKIQETQRKIKQKLKEIEKKTVLRRTKKRRIVESSDSESSDSESDSEDEQKIVDSDDENSSDDSMDRLVNILSTQNGDDEDYASEENKMNDNFDNSAFPTSPLPSIASSPTTIILNPQTYEFAMNKSVLIIQEIQNSNLCRVFSAVIDLNSRSTHQKYECKSCLPFYKFVITVEKKGATVELRQMEEDLHHKKCLAQPYQDVINRHRMIKTIQEEDIDTYKLATYSDVEEIPPQIKTEISSSSEEDDETVSSKISSPISFKHVGSKNAGEKRQQPMRNCKTANQKENNKRRRSLRKRQRL